MSDLRAIILVKDTVLPVYLHFSPFQLAMLQVIIGKLPTPAGLTMAGRELSIDIEVAELKTVLTELQLIYSYRQIIEQMSDLMEPHEYLFSTDRENAYGAPQYDRLLCCLLCGVLFKEGTGAMNLMVTPYLLDYLLSFETTGFTVSVPTSTVIPEPTPTVYPAPAVLTGSLSLPTVNVWQRTYPTPKGVAQKSNLRETPSMTVPAMGKTRPVEPIPPKIKDDESHHQRVETYQRLLHFLVRLNERETDPNSMIDILLDATPDLSLGELTQLYALIELTPSSHHLSGLLQKGGFVLPEARKPQCKHRALATTMGSVLESLKPDTQPLPAQFVTVSRPDPVLDSQSAERESKSQWWLKTC